MATSYGSTYPNNYLAPSKRDFVYAQTDYRVNAHIVALGAFKYEDERGSTVSSGGTPTGDRARQLQLHRAAGGGHKKPSLLHSGSGLEDNGLFGFAATPRASLAYYLFRPTNSRLVQRNQAELQLWQRHQRAEHLLPEHLAF